METTTSSENVNRIPTRPAANRVVDMDIHAWRATVAKLTLKETGELVRALVRAQNMPRPNREQRMLLAIFTRPQPNEVTL